MTFLSNDPGKVERNFSCYVAMVFSFCSHFYTENA